MTSRILDGKPVADAILADAARRISVASTGTDRGWTVAVLVGGNDPASLLYARRIARTCKQVGLRGMTLQLPADASTDDVVAAIDAWNRDDAICGIVLQLPLPPHLDQYRIVATVEPEKDLDGAHPSNFGRVALGSGGFAPCTAEAIVELARMSGRALAGARCVVVGRSNIVGKPAALLLLREHATVTVCHTRTRDLGAITHQADFVITAVGHPGLITGDMLAPGVVVIDAGTTPTRDGLKGDVDADSAGKVAAALTPVPGGVGVVTNAILMRHAADAIESRYEARSA